MEKMRFVFIILYLFLLLTYLVVEVRGNFTLRAVNKIAMAGSFFGFALFNVLRGEIGFFKAVLIFAIFFSFVGDVLLLWDLNKGGYSFFVGNFLFIIYLIRLFVVERYFPAFGIFVALLMNLLYNYMVKSKYLVNIVDGFGYYIRTVILHGSLGMNYAFYHEGRVGILLGIGLFLFMISDFFLSAHMFHDKNSKLLLWCNSFTYFLGMMMVALSVSFI